MLSLAKAWASARRGNRVTAVADRISDALLRRARVRFTEDDSGAVHTTVTGPMGLPLLAIQTWREADRKIACTLSGPLAPRFRPQINAFLAVINRLKIIAEKDGRNFYNLYNPPVAGFWDRLPRDEHPLGHAPMPLPMRPLFGRPLRRPRARRTLERRTQKRH